MAARTGIGWQVAGLVAWLVFSFGAPTSGFFGMPGVWYARSNTPAWNPPSFGLRRMGWVLVEMLLWWSAIAMTIAAFWRVRRWAAVLLCLHLAWFSFAAVLNGTLWWLNR